VLVSFVIYKLIVAQFKATERLLDDVSPVGGGVSRCIHGEKNLKPVSIFAVRASYFAVSVIWDVF